MCKKSDNGLLPCLSPFVEGVIQLEIKELKVEAYNNFISKGFGDKKENNLGGLLMGAVGELSEAYEADRVGRFSKEKELKVKTFLDDYEFKKWFEENVKDTFEDEIADAFIRLGAICGKYNIDIEEHIVLKLQYNKLRDALNGKRY